MKTLLAFAFDFWWSGYRWKRFLVLRRRQIKRNGKYV